MFQSAPPAWGVMIQVDNDDTTDARFQSAPPAWGVIRRKWKGCNSKFGFNPHPPRGG